MTETTAAFKNFASSPMGITVLVVVLLIVAIGGGVPLWRSLKYLFKGFLWLLLVLLVVVLAVGAIWLWMEYKTPDPDKRAKMRQEAMGVFHGGGGKAAEKPAEQPAQGESGHGE